MASASLISYWFLDSSMLSENLVQHYYYGGHCDIVFPSRYSHVAVTPGHELNVDEVVRCFDRHRGELPKVL